jgi:protein-tyrosine phosphatase
MGRRVRTRQYSDMFSYSLGSSILSTYNIERLKENNITYVVSLIDRPLPPWLRTKYQELGIRHLEYRILDEEDVDILPVVAETCEVIEKNIIDSGVLIHCGLGISRSGSVAIGYRTL